MRLKDLTVKKFIELSDIASADFFDTEVDREIALLVSLTGNTKKFYEGMDMPEFRKHSEGLGFLNRLHAESKPAAQPFIKANGKVYAPVYEFGKLTAGQFVDAVHFFKDRDNIISNLPKILASICVPTKRGVMGRRLLRYGSVSHAEVAADMESASIMDAYAISVFFWDVWNAFLRDTGAYMVTKILEAKKEKGEEITPTEEKIILSILEVYGDGITAPKR
jgi:hypothetical protein